MNDATSQRGTKRTTPSQSDARPAVPVTSVHKVEADGVQVFYRDAGATNAPVILLLHGFPSSSFMFQDLIPAWPSNTASLRRTSRASDLPKSLPNDNTPTHSINWL